MVFVYKKNGYRVINFFHPKNKMQICFSNESQMFYWNIYLFPYSCCSIFSKKKKKKGHGIMFLHNQILIGIIFGPILWLQSCNSRITYSFSNILCSTIIFVQMHLSVHSLLPYCVLKVHATPTPTNNIRTIRIHQNIYIN